jgi:hypothetical protein
MRYELGNRFSVLRDDEGRACARHLVHQRETLGFELGGFDVARHKNATMVGDHSHIEKTVRNSRYNL